MSTAARPFVLVVSLTLLARMAVAQDPPAPIGAQAVVHFTFGEDAGPTKDSATVGQAADEGNLVNSPARIPSPFWNQIGQKAVQLDAARQQCLEIADSPDVSAPQGITLSMFCVNLTELTDATYHGLFAKRGTSDGKFSANYGINFQMQNDNFQVYVHDGADYRVATYSTKDAVPFRKLTYVTVTFLAGDAPGQDADTDVDDVRMQYFINGEPVVPKSATRGFVNGNEAWTQDVNLAGLLNKLPLTVGRSEPTIEFTSCVLGDFRLFPRALSAEEVKQLFLEVAGANVKDLMAADKAVAPVVPTIGSLSQPGLQVGQTTQLTVTGSNWGSNPVAVFPLGEVQFNVVDGSAANRLVVNATVPAETVPGIYPFWIKSDTGITKSVALAIDRLPQLAIGSSPDKPAELPAAFFGSLAGGQQQLVYVAGKQGQRLVVDVELKRLGGPANPVIEIKSPSGSPLTIGWGQNSLRGDSRAELILPADGLYTVELHDLTFNAPGTNPFRLKVGDLKLIDGLLPAAASPGAVEVEPVGSGFAPGTKLAGQLTVPNDSTSGSLALGLETGFAGALPVVPLSRGLELVETGPSAEGVPQTIDASFNQSPLKQIAVSGRISQKGEKDRYLLNVTAGHKLKFTLQSDSLGSPLEGELRLLSHPQGVLIAMTSDQPTVGDPTLEFTVPAGLSQFLVQVRDLFGRGDTRSFYRLVIEPADQPRFSLLLNTPTVNLPADGSVMVETQITREGYAGPIKLSILGDAGVTVTPDEIPPHVQGKVLLQLARRGTPTGAAPAMLRLVGESIGKDPVLRHTARLQTGTVAPTFTDTLGVGTTAPVGLTVELQQLPTVLFRGVPFDLGVIVSRHAGPPSASLPVRLSLESTEPVRKRDRNNPAAGDFPVVTATPRILLPSDASQTSVQLTIPQDVVEPVIDFEIRADALSHAYSDRVLATTYSQPAHVEIKNALAPKVDDASQTLAGEVDHKLTGQLNRTAGFTGPVDVTLVGLPAGYTVQASHILAGQSSFELIVRAPKVEAETPVANVKLNVTAAGHLLVPEIAVNLKVVPGK